MNNDTLEKFGQSFQTKILTALITDVKLLDNLSDIIKPKFFESEVNKWIADEIISHHKTYKTIPTADVFKTQLLKLDDKAFGKRIADQLKQIFTQIGETDLDYVKDEFSNFCKNQKIKDAIIRSVDLLKAGDYDRIKTEIDTAMQAGVSLDLGHDYIEEFEKRIEEINRNTISTRWNCIDDITSGGLGPGELGVIVGGAGLGKTWWLCGLGAAAVKQGFRVVHYTLELSEHYVGQRYDTLFTNIPTTELRIRKDEVLNKIKKLEGKLLIKYFPPKGITTNILHNHIQKMISVGNKPDLIILDYADLMLTNAGRVESTYTEQGGIYIDLRGMLGTLKLPCWTASQANRNAISQDIIEADKIADSYAKVMNADFIMSLSRKASDKLSDTARIHIMKNRFGMDGMTFPAKMDTHKGILDVYDSNSPDGIIADKQSKSGESMEKKLLHKKYIDSQTTVDDMG